LADPVSNGTFRSIYIPTHTRAAPYIIGMVWGYVLYRIRTDGIKINKVKYSNETAEIKTIKRLLIYRNLPL